MSSAIEFSKFRVPDDLVVSKSNAKRVMVVGSCLMMGWPGVLKNIDNNIECDFYNLNNAAILPKSPPFAVDSYDFQLIQIPIRSVIPDVICFRSPDDGDYAKRFEMARDRLCQFLDSAMRWNKEHGLLTFVANFLIPQQNPMGRLLPRYDLSNIMYFIEKLNEALAEEVKSYSNAYVFDFDSTVSALGRSKFQDNVLWPTNHGSGLSDNDYEHDQERLEPIERSTSYYPIDLSHYIREGWNDVLAMFRTVRQTDAVKIVIVDLDDTLWRGVAAEKMSLSPSDIEGWPLGVVEALGILKRRGILLAIASKNTESRIQEIWKTVFNGRISLDDFVVRKINWKPKSENIAEILSEVNLLPHNALFIDDNPVERASVQAAFPKIRTLGPNPYLWRRILLWSPETQVAQISAESAARTEMVRAQVERESHRKRMSREEFLASLQVRMTMNEIANVKDPGFSRAFELLNKSNQFNTTGKRWTQEECISEFSKGMRFHTFEVKDKFTAYGSVGVIITKGNEISQFVMSCRVIGMDVETAAVSDLLMHMNESGFSSVTAVLKETPLNLLCRDLYSRNGFTEESPGSWVRSTANISEIPAHIALQRAMMADGETSLMPAT